MQEAIAPVEIPPAKETPGLPDLEARINEVMNSLSQRSDFIAKGFEEFIERSPEALAGLPGRARVGVHPSFGRIGKIQDFIDGIRQGIDASKPTAIPKPRPENPLRPKPKVPGPKPKKTKDPFKELEGSLDSLQKSFDRVRENLK